MKLSVPKIAIGITVAISAFALRATAQGLGLPLADNSLPMTAGFFSASGGFSYGHDLELYDLRANYSPTDFLRAFLDLGIADMDTDSSPIVQAGALYPFKVGLPVDLAARAALYTSFFNGDAEISGLNGMLTASMELFYVGLYGYGGLGANYMSTRDTDAENVTTRDSSFDPAVVLGVLYSFSRDFSVYAEISHIDGIISSAGLKYQY